MNESSERSTIDNKQASDEGDTKIHTWIGKNREIVIVFVAAIIVTGISCAYYLSTMLSYTNPGFTLDDSWIHLQYARTIYEGIPWEYSPGFPSTGSTSPLWSVILSVLFYFSSDPVGLAWGVYIISMCFYMASSFAVGLIVREYTESVSWSVLAIIGFVIIPRNTWLMLSGMETPLFVFVLLFSIIILDKVEMKYDLVLGVLVGIAYLSRPEGILIAFCLPIRFLILTLKGKVDRKRIVTLFVSAALAALVALPWILHCLSVTGLPLPDTFYAKVHVPSESEIEAWNFWWGLFVGQMPFLIIGGFLGIILVVKGKPFPWLFPVILTVMYRLTVPYASLINNNRYLVPVFDLFFVAAIIATAWILEILLVRKLRLVDTNETKLVAISVTMLLLVVPLLPHYFGQATYYGKAAKTVNDLHVNIGTWFDENTPEDSVFATHDAGAVRFISNRTMIDLAGLVSPDIIHGNMTARETLSYLRAQGCNYFVYFDALFAYWKFFLTSVAYDMVYTVTIPPEVHVGGGRPTMSVYQIYWEYTSY
ncbi:MAG: glycosyltransferase family 39 protein [Candidatus Thorarchaeota archaeon]|nr:glycosyltransferase family 39 protein [Candidatus Thorarchaeota archaeon]